RNPSAEHDTRPDVATERVAAERKPGIGPFRVHERAIEPAQRQRTRSIFLVSPLQWIDEPQRIRERHAQMTLVKHAHRHRRRVRIVGELPAGVVWREPRAERTGADDNRGRDERDPLANRHERAPSSTRGSSAACATSAANTAIARNAAPAAAQPATRYV